MFLTIDSSIVMLSVLDEMEDSVIQSMCCSWSTVGSKIKLYAVFKQQRNRVNHTLYITDVTRPIQL